MNKAEGLSPELSRAVLNAIQGALIEEKVPLWKRLLKVLASASALTAILALPLLLVFREQMGAVWLAATVVWWLCLCAGFYLYFFPQPRLAVPGFWSPWTFAKVLLAMVFMTAVEILLCPSFVFLESPLYWNPFEALTELFMRWGGMRFCMFACGAIFSGIGGVASFSLVAKTLHRSTWGDLFKATAIAYLTQLPILGIQVVDEDLRPFALYWMIGGFVGTFFTAWLVRTRASDPLSKRPRRAS